MNQIAPPAKQPGRLSRTRLVRLLGPVFFYFVAAGLATVMLGPLLPSLIEHWKILDEQAGALFTAAFAGEFCGAWFAARNLRSSILYGSVLSAAGCIAVPLAGFGWAPVALFCVGLGLGAGLTAGNVIAGTALPGSRARLLAMLNVAWGLGAIACPVLVRLSRAGGIRLFFFLTAGLLVTASLLALAIPREFAAAAEESQPVPHRAKARLPLSGMPLLLFATALFLYVGVENALGGWLPSYAVRTDPALRASSIALWFWIAELLGRLLVAALGARIREATLYRGSLGLLLGAEVLLCTAPHLPQRIVVALTILSGLALAPIYPLILSFLLARTGNHPRLGAIFAWASLGGAILPWLTGILSTQFQGLRAGLIVPAVGASVLLLSSSALATKIEGRPDE